MTTQKIKRHIQSMDTVLQRPVLNSLGVKGMSHVLDDMARYYEESADVLDDLTLMAAGCRLSSDLSEALIDRLLDTLAAQDRTIQELSETMKQTLRERAHAAALLQKALDIREQSRMAAENAGLGVI